jgi:hypothetical protein
VLQDGQHLAMVLKDGQIVARRQQEQAENRLTFTGATAEMPRDGSILH